MLTLDQTLFSQPLKQLTFLSVILVVPYIDCCDKMEEGLLNEEEIGKDTVI